VRQHEEAHQPPPESECIPFAVTGAEVVSQHFNREALAQLFLGEQYIL